MIIRSLIAMAALLAALVALAACNAAARSSADPVRDEAANQASEAHWMAAAHTRSFERAFRAAAQE